MFRNKILVTLLFSSLVIIGLGACNKNPEDEIINKKAFLFVHGKCNAISDSSSERVRCVNDVFVGLTNDYCAKNELSPANPKCIELHEKVKSKMNQYYGENLTDAIKNLERGK